MDRSLLLWIRLPTRLRHERIPVRLRGSRANWRKESGAHCKSEDFSSRKLQATHEFLTAVPLKHESPSPFVWTKESNIIWLESRSGTTTPSATPRLCAT